MADNREKGEQAPLKKERAYKVTCGTYKSRNEALKRAAEARRAGVYVVIAACKTEYSLFFSGGMSKAAAEAAKKAIEAKKIKAEVIEQ